MPELCRFYNIIIKMIYSDNGQHNKAAPSTCTLPNTKHP